LLWSLVSIVMDVTEVEVVVGTPDVEAEVAAEVMVGTVVEEQDEVQVMTPLVLTL
jgi:hypothetical protein